MNWTKWEELKAKWDERERTRKFGWSWDPNSDNGDLFINECREILNETKDAISLSFIFTILDKGCRWPASMDEYITTKNHTIYDVTRDCWIYAICAAVKEVRLNKIKAFPPPFKWGPYRAWYNTLIGKRDTFKYWLWVPRVIFVDHALVFWGYMILAYREVKSHRQ